MKSDITERNKAWGALLTFCKFPFIHYRLFSKPLNLLESLGAPPWIFDFIHLNQSIIFFLSWTPICTKNPTRIHSLIQKILLIKESGNSTDTEDFWWQIENKNFARHCVWKLDYNKKSLFCLKNTKTNDFWKEY